MTTRINQRQVGSSKSTHLGDQLAALDDRLTAMDNKTGFVKGAISDETKLPALDNEPGDMYLIMNGGYLVGWDANAGWINLSSKPDPVMGDRLSTLENISQTYINTYTETFNPGLVDKTNTNANTGTGYIKAGKNFIWEPFDNGNNTDTASSGITVANGKLSLSGATSGTYTSKEFTTTGTDYAIIDPVASNYSFDGFQQSNGIGGKGATTKYSIYVDKTNNRVWYFYGADGGTPYFKAYNQDGTMYKNETQCVSGTILASYTGNNRVNRIEGAVDKTGVIWIVYEVCNNSEWTIRAQRFNDAGQSLNSFPITPTSSVLGGQAPTAGGIVIDKNGKIWTSCIGGSTTILDETGKQFVYITCFNADGTKVVDCQKVSGTSSSIIYQCETIYDTTRDKIVLIAFCSDFQIYTASYDINGNCTKSFSPIAQCGTFEPRELGAIYDADLDVIVISGTQKSYAVGSYPYGCLKLVKLSPTGLDYLTHYVYPDGTSGNLCRPGGIANPTSTNSSYNTSTTGQVVDGNTDYSSNSAMWYTDNQWCYWQVDLKSVQLFNNVTFVNGANYYAGSFSGYQSRYSSSVTVSYSTDGVSFTDGYTFTGMNLGGWYAWYPSVPIQARYIRFSKWAGGSGHAALTEVMVYPPRPIDALPTTGGTTSAASGTRLCKSGQNYFVGYPTYKYSSTPGICTATIQANDGLVLNSNTQLTGTGTLATRPYAYVHPDGTVRMAYTASGAISEGKYTQTSTTVTYQLSNDGGTIWVNATPGQQVNFASRGTRLKVKMSFTSPAIGLGPEVAEYTLRQWASTDAQTLSSTFMSAKLPSVQAANKAMITAQQALNGGTIDWYLSNNGGLTWMPAPLGTNVSFPVAIGPDVRVKAVLTGNISSITLPTISQYTVVTTAIVSASDFTNLEINLMKTNFKLDSHTLALRNSMKNMVIDTMNDASGINAGASSGYTYDGTNKLVKRSTTSLSKGKSVTVSTSASSAWAGSYLVDGNLANGWSSAIATDGTAEWAYVDMGADVSVDTIGINWRNGVSVPYDWTIDVMTTSGSWTTVYTATNYNPPDNTTNMVAYGIPRQPARYVRIRGTKFRTDGTTTKYMQIMELSVIDSLSNASVVSVATTTATPPTTILLTAKESNTPTFGFITYYASRDGGTTWTTVPPETLTSLSSQPSGTSLVVKAIIVNDAGLNAWAYSWS